MALFSAYFSTNHIMQRPINEKNCCPSACMHNYTHITVLSNYLIYSAAPLVDCTADKKQLYAGPMAVVGRCGRTSSQLPIRQGSSRPVLAVRDCVPTLRAPPHFMPLPLLQRQRGRDGERENCLLLPLYLLANSIAPPPHTHTSSSSQQSNNITPPLGSLLSPNKLPTCTVFMWCER